MMNRLKLFSIGLACFFLFLITSNPIVPVYASIFSDGFESGDLLGWTGSRTDGATIAAEATIKHHGNYGVIVTQTGNYGQANVYENIATQTTLYIRTYVYLPQLSFAVDNDFCVFSEVGNQTTNGRLMTYDYMAYTMLQTVGGVLKLGYHRMYPSNVVNVAPVTFLVNTWYCIEIMMVQSATVGAFQVWLDGVSIVSETGLDTLTGAPALNRAKVGFLETHATNHICYEDCVVVDTSYIGPEASSTPYTADLTLDFTQAISAGTQWVAHISETLGFTSALAGTVLSTFSVLGTATWSLGLDGAYHWIADAPASLSILSGINSGVVSVFNVASSLGWTLGLNVDSILTPLVTFTADLTLGFTTGITSAYSWIATVNPSLAWILYVNAIAVHVATGGGIEGLNFILAIVGISLAVVALISFAKDR